MADYYEILSVPRNATAAEVRRAYARLARERHPDRFQDPAEKERAQEFFKELTTAFNTLANDRSRQEYDASLARPKVAVPEEIARNAFERGAAMFEAKKYHEAIELFRTAVLHAPQHAQYHSALSLALSKNPHWVREAIQSAEKAIQLQPKNAGFHAELAGLLLGQGLRLRARKAAEKALELNPADPRVQQVAREAGAGEGLPPEDEGGGHRGIVRKKP